MILARRLRVAEAEALVAKVWQALEELNLESPVINVASDRHNSDPLVDIHLFFKQPGDLERVSHTLHRLMRVSSGPAA
jgi:hypothetical protein